MADEKSSNPLSDDKEKDKGEAQNLKSKKISKDSACTKEVEIEESYPEEKGAKKKTGKGIISSSNKAHMPINEPETTKEEVLETEEKDAREKFVKEIISLLSIRTHESFLSTSSTCLKSNDKVKKKHVTFMNISSSSDDLEDDDDDDDEDDDNDDEDDNEDDEDESTDTKAESSTSTATHSSTSVDSIKKTRRPLSEVKLSVNDLFPANVTCPPRDNLHVSSLEDLSITPSHIDPNLPISSGSDQNLENHSIPGPSRIDPNILRSSYADKTLPGSSHVDRNLPGPSYVDLNLPGPSCVDQNRPGPPYGAPHMYPSDNEMTPLDLSMPSKSRSELHGSELFHSAAYNAGSSAPDPYYLGTSQLRPHGPGTSMYSLAGTSTSRSKQPSSYMYGLPGPIPSHSEQRSSYMYGLPGPSTSRSEQPSSSYMHGLPGTSTSRSEQPSSSNMYGLPGPIPSPYEQPSSYMYGLPGPSTSRSKQPSSSNMYGLPGPIPSPYEQPSSYMYGPRSSTPVPYGPREDPRSNLYSSYNPRAIQMSGLHAPWPVRKGMQFVEKIRSKIPIKTQSPRTSHVIDLTDEEVTVEGPYLKPTETQCLFKSMGLDLSDDENGGTRTFKMDPSRATDLKDEDRPCVYDTKTQRYYFLKNGDKIEVDAQIHTPPKGVATCAKEPRKSSKKSKDYDPDGIEVSKKSEKYDSVEQILDKGTKISSVEDSVPISDTELSMYDSEYSCKRDSDAHEH